MTGSPWRIRPMTSVDFDAAARIHRDAFGKEAWDKTAIGEVFAMPGASGLMAVDAAIGDLKPIGFLLYLMIARDAELLTIATRRDARRLGLGHALMTEFMTRSAAMGALDILLEVAEDNFPAQRLYGKLGFHCEGVRRDYYDRPGNKRVAAHLLRHRIVSSPKTG